jgi:hypothetical protein
MEAANKTFYEASREVEDKFRKGITEAYVDFLAKLSEFWVGLDPASVNSADLITLGQMTIEAAKGLQKPLC